MINSTPTPPVTPPARSRRTLALATGVVAVSVGIVGIGGPLVAGALDTAPPKSPSPERAMPASSDSDLDLGDVTLEELADELAELGLTLRVDPVTEAAPDVDAEPEAAPGADVTDPFADYTDAELDALSDEEFFQILEDAGLTIDDEGFVAPADGETDHDDTDHDDHSHDAFDEVLGTFAVDGDSIDLSSAPSPEVAEQAREIWERFVQLIPADQRQMLTSFELNPAEAGGAYVYPNEGDPSTWSMGVSLGLGEDLDYVLIHEFAHLLTLQASEVPPADSNTDPDACPTYFTGEGCALSGTTMAEFVQRFWPQSQIDEINRLQENEDYDGMEAFYEDNADDFVTDYATTNPAEDLAETFTVFVLNDRPTGDTIADQKVNLLWADAEMVALREQIRANR